MGLLYKENGGNWTSGSRVSKENVHFSKDFKSGRRGGQNIPKIVCKPPFLEKYISKYLHSSSQTTSIHRSYRYIHLLKVFHATRAWRFTLKEDITCTHFSHFSHEIDHFNIINDLPMNITSEYPIPRM